MKNRLLLFFAVLLLVLIRTPSAYAFTSLNGCLSNPQCAAALGVTGTSGVPQGVTTMALPTAARAAALRASSGAGSTGLKVLFAGGVSSLGPLALHTLTPSETQDLAREWESVDPKTGGDFSANGGIRVRAFSINNNSFREFNVRSYSLRTTRSGTLEYVDLVGTDCLGNANVNFAPSVKMVYYNSAGAITGVNDRTGDISILSGSACSAGAPLQLQPAPTPQRLAEKLGSPSTINPTYDQNGKPRYGQPITFPDGGVVVGPDGVPTVVVPGGSYDPNTGLSDPGVPDAPVDPATQPDPTNTTDPNNADFGSAPSAPTAVAPSQFTRPNFVSYAFQVFSTKFPLDIVGDIPPLTSTVCPSFEFFDKTNELCFVNDALSKLKIPVLVGLAVWGVIAL